MYENGLIRNLREISKFMTSKTGKQTITINILPDISKSKGNQTMKSFQLIEYNMRNIFFQKSCRKEARILVLDPVFNFKKALYKLKASGQYPQFQCFGSSPRLGHTINKKDYETSGF